MLWIILYLVIGLIISLSVTLLMYRKDGTLRKGEPVFSTFLLFTWPILLALGLLLGIGELIDATALKLAQKVEKRERENSN